MVVAYDHEARSRQLFIDEAREREEAEKVRVAETLTKLNAELESAKKSSMDTFKHLQMVTVEKKKVEEKLAEVENELAALKESRDREVENAVASAVATARRTAVAEVQSRLTRGYTYFTEMMAKPMTDLIHFSQAVSNLQILDDLENPDEEFDPVAERAHLDAMKAKLGRADNAFDAMADELKKILGKDHHLSINVGDIVCSPRLEVIAKSVGVLTASGSNDGSLGLRMRGASEELRGEEEEGEANRVDEAAIVEGEIAPVVPQTDRIVTEAPVVEKPSGEAASSTTPAREGNDREDGEV